MFGAVKRGEGKDHGIGRYDGRNGQRTTRGTERGLPMAETDACSGDAETTLSIPNAKKLKWVEMARFREGSLGDRLEMSKAG